MRFILLIIFIVEVATAQSFIKVAFWNVENLSRLSPPSKSEAIRRTIGELQPVVMGVCEVQNRSDLENILLVGYDCVHYNSPDSRGYDVALIYRDSLVKVLNSNTITAAGGLPTRDILVVEAELYEEHYKFVVVHLPSRRDNSLLIRKQRNMILNQIDSIARTARNVVVCGDFNTNPTQNLVSALYNASYQPYKKGKGSYAYRDIWQMYDQILVSRGLTSEDAKIFAKPYLITQTGRFRGYPAKNTPSDHLPVYIEISH